MKISEMFKPNMIRPTIGSRVRHNQTRMLGTVEGRAQISGSTKVWVLNVKYDDGSQGSMVSENEFMVVDKNTPFEAPKRAAEPAAAETEVISMGVNNSTGYSKAETDDIITRGF